MVRTIAILEDDPDIREICTYLFADNGYTVNSYGTVSDFCQDRPIPDLYLLDIRLPDGNGLEVCRKLKTDPISANIPIIMMSAEMDSASVHGQCSAEAFISPGTIIDICCNAAQWQRSEELICLFSKNHNLGRIHDTNTLRKCFTKAQPEFKLTRPQHFLLWAERSPYFHQ